MADFPLLLEAPDRGWAEHVRSLIQRALSSRGSVSIDLPPETPADGVVAPAYNVSGIVVCDEPAGEMLELIKSALVDYEIDEEAAPHGATRLIVRPMPPST